jgi:hypothetical protein
MQKTPPDWEDFVGIMVLLVINSTISFIEENNAGNAAAALMAKLAPKTKVSFRGAEGVYGVELYVRENSVIPTVQIARISGPS